MVTFLVCLILKMFTGTKSTPAFFGLSTQFFSLDFLVLFGSSQKGHLLVSTYKITGNRSYLK